MLLRAAMVTPKLLARAMERFAAARLDLDPPPWPISSADTFRWEDAAILGTHYATILMPVASLAALLTMRWWFAPAVPGPAQSAPEVRTRRYRVILFSLVVLAAGLRLPLATGSLWWDELWNTKYATVGEWRQDEQNPGMVTFKPASWSRAAWYYNKPTNHPVFTLPAKLCHNVWQKVTGAAPGTFSEVVLRLPVLLGGLAALLLTARLATRAAGERAGLTAAALIALHPWLIRYGVDARSYGLTVFFMAAALYSLERATSDASPRRNAWWWAFGACQFLLMWSHVLAHVAICTALFVAAVWLIRRGPSGHRGRLFTQLLVINTMAAASLLMAFLPNLLQAMTWGGRNDDGNLLTGSYLIRTLSQIAAGMEPPLAGGAAASIPVLPWWGLALLTAGGGAAAAAGFRYLMRHQPRTAIMTGCTVAFTGLFLVAVMVTDFFFYHRFILAVSIPVILLAAIGLSRLPSPGLTAGCLAGFAALTFPQTALLLTRSYAPFRETVGELRAEGARLGGNPIPVGYGLGSHVMQSYDPPMRCILVKPKAPDNSAEQLQALIDQARRENRPLLVALGYEGLNRLNLPGAFHLLDDPALFERFSTRHGIEPEFTFDLLRLKPALSSNP